LPAGGALALQSTGILAATAQRIIQTILSGLT
jgi:hypothetical protein